jgi:chitinase
MGRLLPISYGVHLDHKLRSGWIKSFLVHLMGLIILQSKLMASTLILKFRHQVRTPTVVRLCADIELPDNQAGYIAMIQKLRSYFAGADKKYLITGAPQCVVPDANMGDMIAATQFDIVWVQYYNTPQCSARNWITANPNYLSTGIEEQNGFSYNQWADFLVGTASANAKLYIGLPGAPATTDLSTDYYLNTTELSSLVQAYYCHENFGGIMIWEATSADNNTGPDGTYYQGVKDVLLGYDASSRPCCNSSIPPYSNSTSVCLSATTTTVSTTANPTSWANTTSLTQPPQSVSSSASTTSSSSPSSTTSSPPMVTPTPTQPGITTECDLFHLVVSGDVCGTIATTADISLTDFYAWNPTVGSSCANLWLGYYVCIGIL